jgi:hypothetical protein
LRVLFRTICLARGEAGRDIGSGFCCSPAVKLREAFFSACDFPGKVPARCESTYCREAGSGKLIPRTLTIDQSRVDIGQPKDLESVDLQHIMHDRSSPRIPTICTKPCTITSPQIVHTFSCCHLLSISWSMLTVTRMPRSNILTVILRLRHHIN